MMLLLLTLTLCVSSVVIADKRIVLSEQRYFEGDILLPKKNRNGILRNETWENGIIPYIITYNYTEKGLKMIADAMEAIQNHTCIRFVKHTTEPNYINITSDDGCYSGIGQSVGPRVLSLRECCCMYHQTIVHELMHTIGLYHEISRPDRDEHVYLFPENYQNGSSFQFRRKPADESLVYDIPYNFYSIMHYSLSALSKNERMTNFPKHFSDDVYVENIGYVDRAHENDYLKIRRIYQCKGEYPKAPPQTLDPKPECEDLSKNCEELIPQNPPLLWQLCRKSLNICGPNPDGSPCSDIEKDCAPLLDGCLLDYKVMAKCKRSCGLC